MIPCYERICSVFFVPLLFYEYMICLFHNHFISSFSQYVVCHLWSSMKINQTRMLSTTIISGESFYWIGISDLISEGTWIYSSTQEKMRINDFSPGEPNQYTSANCVALWDRYHGKWADEACSHAFTFICESDPE